MYSYVYVATQKLCLFLASYLLKLLGRSALFTRCGVITQRDLIVQSSLMIIILCQLMSY